MRLRPTRTPFAFNSVTAANAERRCLSLHLDSIGVADLAADVA